ncbi:MAG: hypothetical protein NWR54_04695, partial [Paracoccaceae bacterium]|nr:hypothetical protein [Paracoccaceae bacterium]
MSAVHRGAQAAAGHDHGQLAAARGPLMDQRALVAAYVSLPPGAVLLLDGFALLQLASQLMAAQESHDGSGAKGNSAMLDGTDGVRLVKRHDVRLAAFVQYPFCLEPDCAPDVAALCRAQEAYGLSVLDCVIGCSA